MLIFALGNPGKEYQNTYHNAGWIALTTLENDLASAAPVSYTRQKHFSYKKDGNLIFAKADPEGSLYMNQSGIPAKEALDFFKLSPADLLVVHDDSDLPLGEARLEKDRGPAGHHGVESIIEALGTQDFWRARIGIRPPEPEDRRRKAEEFVLKNVDGDDLKKLQSAIGELAVKVREKI